MAHRTNGLIVLIALLLLGLALHCKSGNQPPVIGSFDAPDSVYPGTDHLLSCTATDPNNDPITFSWTCAKGTLTPDTGKSVSWHSPDTGGTARVTVNVEDSHGAVTSDYKDITVTTAADRPPVISGIGGPDSVDAGGSASLWCSASDPDDDTLTYAWNCSVGGLSSSSGATVTWLAPDSAASATITVIVSDGRLSDTATKSIGVRAKPNSPPVIDSISGPSSVPADGNTSLTCYAHDPDGDALTYSWTCERGHVSTPTASTVTWYAPDTSGNVIVTVTVHDIHAASDQRTKTIGVTRVTTTHLDTNGIYIPAGNAQAFYLTCKVGHTASGNFSVPQYDITFMVLDSVNYYKWDNSQSYTYLVQYYKSAGSSYSVVIPSTGQYYFVLDNTYSVLTPKYASLSIKTTTP